MGVFYTPIRHFIVKPETIDTYGNQGEEPPFYVITEEAVSPFRRNRADGRR